MTGIATSHPQYSPDCYGQDPNTVISATDNVIGVLSCFEPGGGEHYYDEREVAAELADIAPLIRSERGDLCG